MKISNGFMKFMQRKYVPYVLYGARYTPADKKQGGQPYQGVCPRDGPPTPRSLDEPVHPPAHRD